ncbi:antitoxin PaaA2 family protein [Burkholderia stagnalis]
MTTETIDQKTLVQLVQAGAVRAARVVGCGNGWAVSARCGANERFLSAKRGDVRVFRRFETLVGFLRDIGISRFDVDASDFDPVAAGRATRPDRAAALKAAHEAAAHDRWFREQVQQALDDPRPSIPDAEVRAGFALRRAALRQRIAGKRGDAS